MSEALHPEAHLLPLCAGRRVPAALVSEGGLERTAASREDARGWELWASEKRKNHTDTLLLYITYVHTSKFKQG